MNEQAHQLRRIKDLCEQLSRAVDSSFRVREHADELRRAATELADSVPAERRAMARVKRPVHQGGIWVAVLDGSSPLTCPVCRRQLQHVGAGSREGKVLSAESTEDVALYKCLAHGVFPFSRREWLPQERTC